MNVVSDGVQFVITLATALESLEAYSEPSVCCDSDRWLVTLQPDNAVVYFSQNRTWTTEEIAAEIRRQIAEETRPMTSGKMEALVEEAIKQCCFAFTSCIVDLDGNRWIATIITEAGMAKIYLDCDRAWTASEIAEEIERQLANTR